MSCGILTHEGLLGKSAKTCMSNSVESPLATHCSHASAHVHAFSYRVSAQLKSVCDSPVADLAQLAAAAPRMTGVASGLKTIGFLPDSTAAEAEAILPCNADNGTVPNENVVMFPLKASNTPNVSGSD